MLKILIFVAAGFLLYKLVTGSKRQKAVQKEKAEENLAASGEMVKDPVCGTYVPKDADIRVRDGDKVHCFCSYDCRDKYLKQVKAVEEKKEK
ncbi:MAG: transcriptional regulator [Thermodesulfobacteriota bacterium]|nr:transcriptional regulator [Thermodesulfobacteriota bacterium]